MRFFGKLVSIIISQPEEYDEEGKRILASYLKVVLLVALCLLPLYVGLKINHKGYFNPSDYIIICLELVLATLFFLLMKGRVVLSAILFLLTTWTALTVMACYADGVQDIAIVGYILIIFLATLLARMRVAFLITAMSIASVWILGFMEKENLLTLVGDEPLNYSRDYTVIFIFVLTVIILFAKNYHDSIFRINRELKERVKAEKELSKNEISLKEKNEELRIAKEKAEESDRLKTAFIQNISHEIRTPMNGIVGFVNLLQQQDLDYHKMPEYLGIINSCTQQLAGLVNDLIDISKIETRTIDLTISDYEASQLIKDIENNFSKSAIEKDLTFTTVNKAGNIVIRSDLGKIKQVLFNLVSNAIKFTPNGSVSVAMSSSGNDLEFSVTDTGIGIRESDKAIIFDRFRQAEIGLSRSYGGSGLGLAISKGIVEFLKGKIWFESQSGKGSVFYFSVPVEFLSVTKTGFADSRAINFYKKIKILAAEDDEINFLYIKELLGKSNCEITWARDGFEAVEIFRRNSDFDIVLMDLKMPVMNGYESTNKIKSINSAIPVIAVTAFSQKEDIERADEVNFDGYIVKPIEKNDLLMKIKNVLN